MSTPSRALPVAFGLLSSGALVLTALSARSQPPPAAAPSASVSAAPSGTGAAPAAGPAGVLRGADIPTEVSKPPEDKKDWEPAVVVKPNDGTTDCVFKRMREWLRIECESRIGGALVAGEPADVKVWSWGDPLAGLPEVAASRHLTPPMTVMVVPLRRGESFLLDLEKTEEGWDWVGPSSAERISITWRASDADPVLLVGARR